MGKSYFRAINSPLLGLPVRGHVQELFIIHDANLQPVQKSRSAHYVNREVLADGEVNNGLPLKLANSQCDLMSKCCKGSFAVLILRSTPCSELRPRSSA